MNIFNVAINLIIIFVIIIQWKMDVLALWY